ncbi:MAG: V-type ATP synthase subunit D [Thermoguttaceae bacterium]
MATKVKLTRPELKRYRDALGRYERFLPMLKLKQQQLQVTLRDAAQARRAAEQARDEVDASLRRYRSVLADRAGLPLEEWSRPSDVQVGKKNIAGVEIPVFEDVAFPEARYSLFGTPPWVDQTLADLRERSRRDAAVGVLRQEEELLRHELTRIIQRVNLFEKIMIPQAREAIRKIRIKLGDEMTAGVGRSKIAKGKLSEALTDQPADASPPERSETP